MLAAQATAALVALATIAGPEGRYCKVPLPRVEIEATISQVFRHGTQVLLWLDGEGGCSPNAISFVPETSTSEPPGAACVVGAKVRATGRLDALYMGYHSLFALSDLKSLECSLNTGPKR